LSPASSAAIALALQLDGAAGAAALIGCSVQFTVFAFLSLKENDAGNFLGQLIITPKLQTANVIRNPKVRPLSFTNGHYFSTNRRVGFWLDRFRRDSRHGFMCFGCTVCYCGFTR